MIDALLRSSLRQRLIVVVLALVLLAFGLDAARRLSVDAFPDVTNVQVQIATEASGRSPEEVERFVTVPLEIAMTGLPGLTELRSLNKPGLSLITLVFTDATNIYFARQLVMERLLEMTARLPEDVVPVLGPVSTALGEVYQYTLERADDGDRPLTKEELVERRTVQDWVVRPLLRSIPGVAEINSTGGYVKQYQVLVDPDRMRYYGVTIQDVWQAVARNNANAGGGILPQRAERYLVRGIGLVRNLDDIRSIVLKEHGATPVYVRDVAEVAFGEEVRNGAMVKDGYTEAVGGVVMMIRAGNAKEVVTRVKKRVAEINDRGMLADGLRIVPYYDRSQLVDAALWTVTRVLLEGTVLVVVVLFLFLGDLRSSLIVIATLVLTPLVTFLVMTRLGISANLMSLGGLAIAIGLIVDGSVVVVENAFARLAERPGESRARVILEAVQEVARPVIFGVGIIILVFLPLMTLRGMEGKMFAPLAWTIAIALGISLVLSLTLTPALASFLLRRGEEKDTRLMRVFKSLYTRLLDQTLAHPRITAGAAVLAFVGSLSLLPLLGTAFIPEMREGSLSPLLDKVPNISIEEAIGMEMEAMRLVREVPGVGTAVSRLGRGESPADPAGINESDPIVSLAPRDTWPKGWTQDDIADAVMEKLKVIPGVQLVMAQPISDRVDEMVTGVRADVAVKLFGDDLQVLREKAQEIARVAAGIRGVRDFRLERLSGQQYLALTIDRQAIARVGLNVADVHDVIETAVGGRKATEVFEGERRFAAVVRLPERFRDSIEDVRKILLTSPNGAQVTLENLAHVEILEGPAQVSRELAKRRVVVGVNVRGRDLGGFVADLQREVEQKVELPEGYYLEWGGQFQNMQRALGHLMIIVPITIAGIYFLLFLLFNSLRFATLIITVLPFASIGGIVGLWLTGEYLSVPASVGFIALWGIAVLNGVVLVSYIRKLREEGVPQRDAVLAGARQRFRPVMMTATVAALGLIPFLFASGPGAEVQRPLAIVVIGGLTTSTLLTLVVVPALYGWFEEDGVEAWAGRLSPRRKPAKEVKARRRWGAPNGTGKL
jgi:cobalt-zinc-cadmium resistance protein CzcA